MIIRDMGKANEKLTKKEYEDELKKLQLELVRLQAWVKNEKKKVVILFEGRDAAGKGGVIKAFSARLNPRVCKIVALGVPTEREKSQWYFQRYASQLPAGGEIALFDRSWYNRAGVEKVMGYCTEEEYKEFLRSCPEFEKMLIRSGVILLKYWFSVGDDEQERRFRERIDNPLKRWKFSQMDLLSREKWSEYSEAKDQMFYHTDTRKSPWFVVNANDKRRSRLNCISHIISKIPFEYEPEQDIELPPLEKLDDYERPPINEQTWIPELY